MIWQSPVLNNLGTKLKTSRFSKFSCGRMVLVHLLDGGFTSFQIASVYFVMVLIQLVDRFYIHFPPNVGANCILRNSRVSRLHNWTLYTYHSDLLSALNSPNDWYLLWYLQKWRHGYLDTRSRFKHDEWLN